MNTPLFQAVRSGDVVAIRAMLDGGADVNMIDSGWPLVALAVACGRINVVQLLIEYGAVLDVWTDNGFAPLHIAVTIGDEPMAKVLLNAGCDVNILTR